MARQGNLDELRVLLFEGTKDPQLIPPLVSREGLDLVSVAKISALTEQLQQDSFDVLLLVLNSGEHRILDILWDLSRATSQLPVVLLSDEVNEGLALEAIKMGVQDVLLQSEVSPEGIVRALRFAVERKRVENAVLASQERYSLAMRSVNDGLWDWDLQANCVFLSSRFMALLGEGEKERRVPSAQCLERIHPDHRKGFSLAVEEHIAGRALRLEYEFQLLHKDGSYRWFHCRALAVRDASGKTLRLVGSQSDISKYKDVDERLVHALLHDSLTGLAKRPLFMRSLEQALAEFRSGAQSHVSVLVLDLDRFKLVNDSLGHDAGDFVLREVARRLRWVLGPEGVLARLGGDEFAILIGANDQGESARACAERIKEVLKEPLGFMGRRLHSSASIGIACVRKPEQSAEELLRDADVAMYAAKQAGRNRYMLFDKRVHRGGVDQLDLESDLRNALDKQEFVLHYQPIVSLDTRRPIRFEALLRWNSPIRGMVQPGVFIPVLEESGLIVPVGQWVLKHGCQQLMALRGKLGKHGEMLALAVNVSGVQFAQSDFVAVVEAALKASKLPKGALILEVTETVLMDNPAKAANTLQRLRELGVSIEIDDFGTGYSSLSYLQSFPIDGLKIDRSFVRDIGAGGGGSEIVRAVIALAHNLGMQVVAEGIETPEQMNFLHSLGCDFGQGFLFAKPQADFLLEYPLGQV